MDANALNSVGPVCGIVMPISGSEGYPAEHWKSVLQILEETLAQIGYKARIVSQETSSGVIHQRIVSNLYRDLIVVCDVSSRNPNVMFELGMRLAFDKPTVIIKDDVTPFSFDISGIEHVQYGKSLRYSEVKAFKETLAKVVMATILAAEQSPDTYSPFLKHVGAAGAARILDVPSRNFSEADAPLSDFVVKQLGDIQSRLSALENGKSSPRGHAAADDYFKRIFFLLSGVTMRDGEKIRAGLLAIPRIRNVSYEPIGDKLNVLIEPDNSGDRELRDSIVKAFSEMKYQPNILGFHLEA